MNGLKRNKLRLYGYHFSFWVLYGVYFYGVNKLDNHQFAWQRLVVYIPAFLLIFYSVFGILWANFSQRFTWRGVVYLALFYCGFALLATFITFKALPGTAMDLTTDAWKDHSLSGFLQTLLVLLSNYSVFAAGYFWMRSSIANAQAKQMEAEKKAAALQRLLDSELEKRQLEYQSLSQQVSPHFLANVTNSWRSRLGDGHGELAGSMEDMHGLMVYHMDAIEQEHAVVPLRRELNFLTVYCELMRQPDRPVYLDWELTDGLEGYTIPPTTLITLLENAFKHGVTQDPQCPVRIRLTIAGGEIGFYVRNRIKDTADGESHGVGLANLRRRLDIMYGHRANLKTHQVDGDFVAHLSIAN